MSQPTGTSTASGYQHHSSARLSRKTLERKTLERMAEAGITVVDCMRDLHLSGSNLVLETLRGCGDFTEWEHYPPDDVRDLKSHAQYYFHAHPPDGRDAPDYGHFHMFMGREGISDTINPVASCLSNRENNTGLCHIIALSMSPNGLPERLFTTNRWVTGDTWYAADDVIEILNGFAVDLDVPSLALNRWLTAMLVLFLPQIEDLLHERDRRISQWQLQHPMADVFEDRRLEITSAIDISLFDHIEWLDRQLDAQPDSAVQRLR